MNADPLEVDLLLFLLFRLCLGCRASGIVEGIVDACFRVTSDSETRVRGDFLSEEEEMSFGGSLPPLPLDPADEGADEDLEDDAVDDRLEDAEQLPSKDARNSKSADANVFVGPGYRKICGRNIKPYFQKSFQQLSKTGKSLDFRVPSTGVNRD